MSGREDTEEEMNAKNVVLVMTRVNTTSTAERSRTILSEENTAVLGSNLEDRVGRSVRLPRWSHGVTSR